MRMVTPFRYFPVYRMARYAESSLLWEEFTMIRKCSGVLAMSLLLATIAASSAFAQANKEESSMPKVGDTAPDFTLKYIDSSGPKEVKLSDYRGKKNVVLAFYI